MRKFLILFLLLLIIGVGTIYWWYGAAKPVSTNDSVRDFLITKGASAASVANKLQSEGFIKNSLAFKLYVQIAGKAGRIQAGEYALSPNLSLFQIVEELLRGPKEIWVTVPEGFRREEVAEKFAAGLLKDDEETFINEFLQASSGKEGFLFPDTYIFPKVASTSAIVNKLISTFEVRVDSQLDADIERSAYSLNQIITMASVVERETITEGERPIVAGILYKRLQAGWPLQADATLQYAIGSTKCKVQSTGCKWWEIPEVADRKLVSPYNTYRNNGLPPAPIANPGLSSITAAIYPEESEYWYYLHDEKGKIYYARTLEEHNDNIRKYITGT